MGSSSPIFGVKNSLKYLKPPPRQSFTNLGFTLKISAFPYYPTIWGYSLQAVSRDFKDASANSTENLSGGSGVLAKKPGLQNATKKSDRKQPTSQTAGERHLINLFARKKKSQKFIARNLLLEKN